MISNLRLICFEAQFCSDIIVFVFFREYFSSIAALLRFASISLSHVLVGHAWLLLHWHAKALLSELLLRHETQVLWT